MNNRYFYRLHAETDNRFWVNNPTPHQAGKAIKAGAIACTTNPTYAGKMLSHPETADRTSSLIVSVLESGLRGTRAEAAVQRLSVVPILDAFLPVFRSSGGTQGFVSLQANPFLEEDAGSVLKEMEEYLDIAPNVIAKIPVTRAGVEAIDTLVRENVPIIATEIMSISQAVHVCEVYEAACAASGNCPPFFVTHITGIFDEFLQEETKASGVPINPGVLQRAGVILARRQHMVLKKRGFGGVMLGGGARGTHHFTEMVRSDIHVTINWDPTALRLITDDEPIEDRFRIEIPSEYSDQLRDGSSTFRRAYDEGALASDEYADFGPVEYFRREFCNGWQVLSDAISARCGCGRNSENGGQK